MDYSPASLANRPFFLCSRHDPWLVRRAVSSITAEKPEPPLPKLNLMVKKCTPLQTFSRKPGSWKNNSRKNFFLSRFLLKESPPIGVENRSNLSHCLCGITYISCDHPPVPGGGSSPSFTITIGLSPSCSQPFGEQSAVQVALSPFFISPGEAGPPVMIQRCKPLIISVEQRSRTYYAQRTHPVPSIRFGWFMKPKSQSWNDFLVGRWPSLSMCDSGFRRTTSLKFPYHNTTPFIGIITSAAAYGLPTKPDLRKILIKTNMYYQIEWGGW